VLFAFEVSRRLRPYGVGSCAVDPGGVVTNIWQNTRFDSLPLSWFINTLYAPPADGAIAVVHAATAPWDEAPPPTPPALLPWRRALPSGGSTGKTKKKRRKTEDGEAHREAHQANEDLRFYAKGLFAWPTITSWRGTPRPGFADSVRGAAWGLAALLHSALDWPMRKFSGGLIAARTTVVPAAPLAYDRKLCRDLWEQSADAVGVSRECLVQK
jgi:hypothetical protein